MGTKGSKGQQPKGKVLTPIPVRTGRPSAYSMELALEICSRIAAGELLMDICNDPWIPPTATVRGWDLRDKADLANSPFPGFSSMYARARAMQIEQEVDEIRNIADTPRIGVQVSVKELPGGGSIREVKRGDMVERSRLQLDARKWRAAKIAKNNYGDRIADLEAQSGNPEDAPRVIIEGGLPEDE